MAQICTFFCERGDGNEWYTYAHAVKHESRAVYPYNVLVLCVCQQNISQSDCKSRGMHFKVYIYGEINITKCCLYTSEAPINSLVQCIEESTFRPAWGLDTGATTACARIICGTEHWDKKQRPDFHYCHYSLWYSVFTMRPAAAVIQD